MNLSNRIFLAGKEDKSPVRGRKPEDFISCCLQKRKEDKSPVRGRKQDDRYEKQKELRKEDKSPVRGRKQDFSVL